MYLNVIKKKKKWKKKSIYWLRSSKELYKNYYNDVKIAELYIWLFQKIS